MPTPSLVVPLNAAESVPPSRSPIITAPTPPSPEGRTAIPRCRYSWARPVIRVGGPMAFPTSSMFIPNLIGPTPTPGSICIVVAPAEEAAPSRFEQAMAISNSHVTVKSDSRVKFGFMGHCCRVLRLESNKNLSTRLSPHSVTREWPIRGWYSKTPNICPSLNHHSG